MSEWKEYKLGDFMEFNPKISLKKDTVARKITMDLLVPHSRDIYSWTYEPYSGGAKFQNGDTIMARITPCLENGKHAFISLLDENEIAYGSTEYIVIRGKKGISDNLFVYYLTHFPSFKDAAIKSMVGTSGRQRAQVDVLENLTMKLPSLPEQKRIANILTRLDDKIAVNKKINDNLEQQAQALFKSWFVDFEPFRNQPFVESELGMIPEGWRVGTLGDIMSISSGKRPPRKSNEKTQEFKIPLIGASSIMGYTMEWLYDSPILVTGRVGTHGIIQRFNSPCWPSDNTLVIQSDHYEFSYHCLLSVDFHNLNRGSTQPLITQTDLKNIHCIIPTKEVLDDFEKQVVPLMKKANNCIEESRTLSQLRDTLLPHLMSGELSVDGLKGQQAVSPGQRPGSMEQISNTIAP